MKNIIINYLVKNNFNNLSEKQLDKLFKNISDKDKIELIDLIVKYPKKWKNLINKEKQNIYLNNVNFNNKQLNLDKKIIKNFLIKNNLYNIDFIGLIKIKNYIYLTIISYEFEVEILRQTYLNININDFIDIKLNKKFLLDLFPFFDKKHKLYIGNKEIKFILKNNKIKFENSYEIK